MKRIVRSLLVVALFASTITYGAISSGNSVCNCCRACCDIDCGCYSCSKCCTDPCDGYPFLLPRSQGRNSAIGIVGWQEFVNKYCQEDRYGALSLAIEYKRTFRPERLAHFYFGNDLINCCELYIQGDNPCGETGNKHPRAWQAEYFGLPDDYSSKVRFCPHIENAIIDLNYYAGLDNITKGFYVKIHAPLVWTRWQLCMCENVICDGDNGIGKGILSKPPSLNRNQLPKTFTQVMGGGVTYGDMKSPMRYGLMDNCRRKKIRFAELDLTLGHNWYLEEDYHFGGTFYFAAPTGSRPCSKYLFAPLVGNGHHWEFGVGLSGSYIFWRDCECDDRYLGVWMEATIAHLFRDWQNRSFDFCGKPNSRYMLLAQMGENSDAIKIGDNHDTISYASYQYKENLIPAINWSTFCIGVSVPIQADIAVKVGWVKENFSVDLGYNLWARTGEKFTFDNCLCDDGKKYAIKGSAYMYGYDSSSTSFPGIPFSQSMADIHGGIADNDDANTKVDNRQKTWNSSGEALLSLETGEIRPQMNGSEPPILVSRRHLNTGRSPSSLTHKLFGNISYAKKDQDCCCPCDDTYIPFIGIGAEVEFASDNWKECCCDCNSCTTNCNIDRPIAPTVSTGTELCSCDTCYKDCCCGEKKRGGLTQWGIWLKMGISFE